MTKTSTTTFERFGKQQYLESTEYCTAHAASNSASPVTELFFRTGPGYNYLGFVRGLVTTGWLSYKVHILARSYDFPGYSNQSC